MLGVPLRASSPHERIQDLGINRGRVIKAPKPCRQRLCGRGYRGAPGKLAIKLAFVHRHSIDDAT